MKKHIQKLTKISHQKYQDSLIKNKTYQMAHHMTRQIDSGVLLLY